MIQVPKTVEEAIAQAKEATLAALNDGYKRVQVELLMPEIALQAQSIAQQFVPLFEEYGEGLKLLFPDTGAAALARRDWGETLYKVSDLGSKRTPVEYKISDEDQAFLVVCPSSVEVEQVEKLCNLAGDRPVIILIPQMENIAMIGIGYAGRQLRERFLSTLESCYYLKPSEDLVISRCYPSPWQVWLEKEGQFELVAEEPQKPMADRLDSILNATTQTHGETAGETVTPSTSRNAGVFGSMKRFLRALSQ